ncbi:integrator complex subunit 12 isoform X2 [Carcharodon carcharias]|uniref:integrator complex subunit 12 isoform X2 n=1 Tax=Carcharodon carcharias TaxID=13397 RepID=UPI001B7F4977|nr:integrator complex subunit 12 isoform X2 [Carcharodon carcharias]
MLSCCCGDISGSGDVLENMAVPNLELDPLFLKALGYLHSKSKDSAEKLKALLDETLARGSDSSFRQTQKEVETPKIATSSKSSSTKQDSKVSSSLSSGNNGKSSSNEKTKKEAEKRPAEKVKLDPLEGVDPQKKARLEKAENLSSPITVQSSKELPMPDLPGFESAEDFAMEMGLACVVCRQMTVTSGNQLVECQECHNLYHQDCHKPQVTDKDVNDPRLVWYCARCTRQMKKMAQKTQKAAPKASNSVANTAPSVKDPLVKKPEMKLKQEVTTFQAFKRTEVKTSSSASGNSSNSNTSSSSVSGLTGWAAFGAKTSTAAPSTAKLGSSVQSTSGKPTASSTNQKSVGLSGLATSKAGLGSKMTTGINSSTAPIKPPPPLTLGKPSLNRSSSNDNVSKVGLTGPGSSGIQSSSGNGGGTSTGTAGNNGAKTPTETVNPSVVKLPTSQESQLNAMKRLQMVKKKAAQKKLKK